VDSVVVVFESVSKEFDSDVVFFLGGVFHPVTVIFRGRFDKVCGPCDVTEEIRFQLAVYDAVDGNFVAEVYRDCCQGFGLKPDLCNALAGVKARHWRWVVFGLGV